MKKKKMRTSTEKEEEDNHNPQQQHSLPEDIQIEILSKLEVKSLMRSKLVSRYWNSLVKVPSFISKHSDNWSNLESGKGNYMSLLRVLAVPDPDPGSSLTTKPLIDFPLSALPNISSACPPTEEEDLFVVVKEKGEEGREEGSYYYYHERTIMGHPCNGLFLLRYQKIRTRRGQPMLILDGNLEIIVAIVNPATREMRALPPSNVDFTAKSNLLNIAPVISFPHKHSTLGLGFDPQTNDYQVVRLFIFHPHLSHSYNISSDCCNSRCGVRAELFSLNRGSWREVYVDSQVANLVKKFFPFWPGLAESVFASGAVHWLIKTKRTLVSFDFVRQVFTATALPPHQDFHHPKLMEKVNLAAWNNDRSLAVMLLVPESDDIWDKKRRLEIWVLQAEEEDETESGSGSRWERVKSVELDPLCIRPWAWSMLFCGDDTIFFNKPGLRWTFYNIANGRKAEFNIPRDVSSSRNMFLYKQRLTTFGGQPWKLDLGGTGKGDASLKLYSGNF